MQLGSYTMDINWDAARPWAEKAFAVLAILIVTWALAKVSKWAFARLVDKVPMLQRDSGSGESVGAALGKIVSLLIWLLGMIAVLQRLSLDNVIKPLQTLLDNIMGFIPNIIGAGVILFVGLVVAKIIKQLVETTLSTVNLDRWAAMGGVEKVTGNNTISRTIATICYVLIIIPIAIAALQTLQISAISDPATMVLQTVLNTIPLLIGASILLGIGFFIGGWVSGLLEDLLTSFGVDRTIQSTGLVSAAVSPSKIFGRVAMVGIMLFVAIAATRMLNFPELTAILNTVLEVGSRVIFGSVIIGIGFLIANLVSGMVGTSGENGRAGPMIIKYAVIGLFVAMGLSQMGIGGPIVELAFGAIVIAAAVAGALAFGLGGRDAAARYLLDVQSQRDASTPAAPKAPAKGTIKK
jgi:Conserved TM helix